MIEAPELPSADSALGVTHARIVDGMLECWSFNVNRREWMMRHDAIVDGVRQTIAWPPLDDGRDLEVALRRRRPAALAAFQARERSE